MNLFQKVLIRCTRVEEKLGLVTVNAEQLKKFDGEIISGVFKHVCWYLNGNHLKDYQLTKLHNAISEEVFKETQLDLKGPLLVKIRNNATFSFYNDVYLRRSLKDSIHVPPTSTVVTVFDSTYRVALKNHTEISAEAEVAYPRLPKPQKQGLIVALPAFTSINGLQGSITLNPVRKYLDL